MSRHSGLWAWLSTATALIVVCLIPGMVGAQSCVEICAACAAYARTAGSVSSMPEFYRLCNACNTCRASGGGFQSQTQQPQGIPCGSGYCQFGTSCSRFGNICLGQGDVDCGNYSCAVGNKCSRGGGCVAANAQECGNGYCNPGQICSRHQSCVDPAAAYGNTMAVLLWVHDLWENVSNPPPLARGERLTDALKNQPVEPTPWQQIAALSELTGTKSAGVPPGSGVPPPPGFNPFTNKFDIEARQLNAQGAPEFIPPTSALPPPGQLERSKNCTFDSPSCR
jgi:hypothetical protein